MTFVDNVRLSESISNTPTISEGDRICIQIVEFILGTNHFAIDLFEVREVVEYTSITTLPNAPDYIKGIIDLRGEITTIIDLKHCLNITEKCQVSIDSSRIIVLDVTGSEKKVGVLVDDVTSVSTFENNQVDYTSASVFNEDIAIIGIIKRFVLVQGKEKNELIIWIDIKHLLQGINE